MYNESYEIEDIYDINKDKKFKRQVYGSAGLAFGGLMASGTTSALIERLRKNKKKLYEKYKAKGGKLPIDKWYAKQMSKLKTINAIGGMSSTIGGLGSAYSLGKLNHNMDLMLKMNKKNMDEKYKLPERPSSMKEEVINLCLNEGISYEDLLESFYELNYLI